MTTRVEIKFLGIIINSDIIETGKSATLTLPAIRKPHGILTISDKIRSTKIDERRWFGSSTDTYQGYVKEVPRIVEEGGTTNYSSLQGIYSIKITRLKN